MGANISTCCTDTTTTTARRVGGGSSSSSGSDSDSTDTDGSGRTTLDNNNNNAQQTVHHHHLSNRTQKHTSGRHHTTTTAVVGSGGATRHPQQYNSVSTGSDTANPSIAFPTLALEQQTQSVETTHHHNAASQRIPQQQQPLHTAARNPLVAPVTRSTTPLPSTTDYLFAYDAGTLPAGHSVGDSEEDVVSQRRGAMIGMVDMIGGGAPSEFEDAFGRPRDNTTTPLSHGIKRACSDNNTSSSLHHHHHQQQSSSPRQQEFGPTVFHVAGNGGVPAAHLAAEKTAATVVPPSSHSNSTTGHHGVKNRIEGSAGLSSDSQLVMASRNEGSISSNLPSGQLENEPSEPPTVFAQQQYRTAQIAANIQQHSSGTIVTCSSTTVPGGTDDDLILSATSQASTRASTLTQQQANGAVDEEQLHVLSPAVVVAEQTIVVVKRHSAPIVSTTAIHSQSEGECRGNHTNPLSPGVAPPPPLPQHLPLTSFDSLRSTQPGTAAMEQPSEQKVPQLFVEVVDGVQWGGDRNNSAPATSLRHPSTASGSGRSASLYQQVRQQRQQQSAGSDVGGSGGGGWSSRDSSPLSSVSSVSSLGSGNGAAGGDGERRRRRRGGSSRRSSQDVASVSSNVSAGQIRRASRPQRSPNPHAEVETELTHEGAHVIGSAAEILPTSANILREEVERCIGDDRALLTILSQGSLQKLTPTANAANTPQQHGQVQSSHRQQSSIVASDGRYQQTTMAAPAPTAAQVANNNSSTNISSGSAATHQSSGSAADAINNSSLGVQGLAPYAYTMDGGQASAGTGGGAEDPYRRQSSLQASSIASVGGLVTVPSGANASLFSSEGGASLQTPGGYLHHSRLLSGNASGSAGGRSPGGALGASSNSNSQHPLLGGISTSFQTGGSLGGGGGAASPSYASDPQLFPSSGAPTTGRASSWGLGASGMESTSGYAGGALEEASGQSGPLLRLHWTNSLLMRMAQGGGEGASSLPASGMATPVACSS